MQAVITFLVYGIVRQQDIKPGFPIATPYYQVVTQRELERAMGIEPMPEAWRASVPPLNYTRFLQTK